MGKTEKIKSPLAPAKIAKGQLITLEDLIVIRDSYGIPRSIALTPLKSHETSWDYRPEYLYLNESILRAGVQIPFEFGVAEVLSAFYVSPARVTPHSWKVIEGDVKAINNPLDPTLGWKSRFFFAHLSSKMDTWGVLKRWVEPLPNPISRLNVGLSSSQRLALMYFPGTALHWFLSKEGFLHWCESMHFVIAKRGRERSQKRAHLLAEGSILAGPNPYAEDVSELSPLGGTSIVAN
ncbi:hypothetical protein ACLOJK_027094 [Asimina triloba]